MTPSREAIDLKEAHDLYRRAIGTQNEQTAMAHLEAVVRRVKKRSEEQLRETGWIP